MTNSPRSTQAIINELVQSTGEVDAAAAVRRRAKGIGRAACENFR